jgi:hypothetical protein
LEGNTPNSINHIIRVFAQYFVDIDVYLVIIVDRFFFAKLTRSVYQIQRQRKTP